MGEATIRNLVMYNQLWMELDDLYSDYAKSSGLPECAFWIFYTLYESKDIYTQKDLSEKWSFSRQTVNSALKKLESEGLVRLVPLPGQKKNKQLVLTEEGDVFAQKVIIPIIEAEKNAFGGLGNEEQKMLLCLTQKYLRRLQAEIN